MRESIGKLPDGLISVGASRYGLATSPPVKDATRRDASAASPVDWLDWVEVESAYKPSRELERVLQVGWRLNMPVVPGSSVYLDRLMIAFDRADLHETRIRRAALAVARKASPDLRGAPVKLIVDRFGDLFDHIDLVRLSVTPPLRIAGHDTITLLQSFEHAAA